MVTQLAMGYLSLRQVEKQKDSPGWGCSHFIPTVHDVYGDVSPYTPPTGNSV